MANLVLFVTFCKKVLTKTASGTAGRFLVEITNVIDPVEHHGKALEPMPKA